MDMGETGEYDQNTSYKIIKEFIQTNNTVLYI